MNTALLLLCLAPPADVLGEPVSRLTVLSRVLAEIQEGLEECVSWNPPVFGDLDPKEAAAAERREAEIRRKLALVAERCRGLQADLVLLAERLERASGEGLFHAKSIRKTLDLFARESLGTRLHAMERRLAGDGFRKLDNLETVRELADSVRATLRDGKQVLLAVADNARHDALRRLEQGGAELRRRIAVQKVVRDEIAHGEIARESLLQAQRTLTQQTGKLPDTLGVGYLALVGVDPCRDQRKAEAALEGGRTDLAATHLAAALESLERAANQVAQRTSRLRTEIRERWLTDLVQRSDGLLTSQQCVRDATAALARTGPPIGEAERRKQEHEAYLLTEQQGTVVREARELYLLVECREEGTLVPLARSVVDRSRTAADLLRRVEAAAAVQALEQTLAALEKFRATVRKSLDDLRRGK